MEKNLSKKYAKELKLFPAEAFLASWLLFLRDLINETESTWDYGSVRYKTVMSGAQWKEFSTHKDRRPFRTKVALPQDHEKRVDRIFEIIGDSFKLYKVNYRKSQDLKQSITTLIETSLNAYYEVLLMRFGDEYMGRAEKDRDNGVLEPTHSGLLRLNYAITEYARFKNVQEKSLRKEIFKITPDGRVSVLAKYLATCRMDKHKRKRLTEVLRITGRDMTLSFTEVKLGWHLWKKIRSAGFDLDSYLVLNDMPKFNVAEKQLLSFLNKKEYTAEILKHLEDELPDVYRFYKKKGYVNYGDIIHSLSVRKKYPTKLKTKSETQAMIKRSEDEVYKVFPLAKRTDSKNLILNPTHPESTGRAFQSTTKNVRRENVNVIVMTPMSSQYDQYLRTFAHECTHAMHRTILRLAEDASALPRGASEKIPGTVMEDFSQLVDHNFGRGALPYRKKYGGREFSSLQGALTIRHQAPYGLMQMTLRKMMDKWWNQGKRGTLTEKTLWNLKNVMDRKFDAWYRTGVDIRRSGNSFDWFDATSPGDGLVYMKRYLVGSKGGKKSGKGMQEAFKARFGESWVANREARLMLFYLMYLSGKDYRTHMFYKIIEKEDVKLIEKKIRSLGVKESEI